jgi:menaquinone-dependent protoporphyrinogen oxidase
MSVRILVAFATRYGSTGEVAEAVAGTLREAGMEAEARPARAIKSLEGYDGVVLGTPIYLGALLKDAVAFLEKHRNALEQVPVAVFALGPTSAEDEFEGSQAQLSLALAKLPWFSPSATRVFVGSYDPARLRFLDKALTALPASPLHGRPARDDRDWSAIRDWARDSSDLFRRPAETLAS